MQHAVIRTSHSRTGVPGRGHAAAKATERAPRMIRGYDAAGTVLFSVAASKFEHPSARKAQDAKTIGARVKALGDRLARICVELRGGKEENFLVAADGGLRNAVVVDGRVIMAF